jgi:hypothetical protein
MDSDRFALTTYLVRRKVFQLFGGTFYISDTSGTPVFYSRQKKFKLKEDIRLFTGEDMAQEVLTIKARQILDFSAAYDVVDPTTGEKVGAMKRKGLKSIVKDEWIFMNPYDQEIGFIKEDKATLAVLRRILAGFVSSLATALIPQVYHGDIDGKAVCTFRQNFNPFVMKLTLDFSPDMSGLLDRRLGIAAAVLLCAIEGKQR